MTINQEVERLRERHARRSKQGIADEHEYEDMTLIEQLVAERETVRAQALEACITACADERLSFDVTDPTDISYNAAIDDCIKAIRALAEKPKEEKDV